LHDLTIKVKIDAQTTIAKWWRDKLKQIKKERARQAQEE